ncbi:MAG: GNAT family N-acetyltransferase [Nanoarchaeota archaeon]
MILIEQFNELHSEDASKLIKENLIHINSKDTPKFAINELFNVYTPNNLIEMAKHRKFFVLKKEEKIIGTIAVDLNNITTLFIDLNFQNKGYGSILLEHAEKIIKTQNYSHIKLNSSISAINFFDKKGYKIISNVEMEGQTVSYLMSKAF